MRFSRLILFSLVAAAVCLACAGTLFGQQSKQQQGEEVIRVNTDLVQTDVMVFSKDGGFVDGLKREHFDLRINGKPREISFFERVAAGSRNEEAQLAAARGQPAPGSTPELRPVPLDRGRVVFFFLDDIHLSFTSISEARKMLTRFVDHEMGQNDEAAITSASGQIGFLQQLTSNKAVLRAAIERLKTRPYSVTDSDRPPMSEYQAEMIHANDRDVANYFIEFLRRDIPNLPIETAASMVRARADHIVSQTQYLTTVSLASLEKLARSSAQLPGRKVIFVISDGFFLSGGNSAALERIHAIASTAAHSGIVIYSIDARGLIAPGGDSSSTGNFDPSGRLQRAATGEIGASQDGLKALARDTGGRSLFNTNSLFEAIPRALKETSVYYLVAWRPENEEERNGRIKKIEVNVVQRPELTVRLRRNLGQVETPAATTQKSKDEPSKKSGDQLRDALFSAFPKVGLPSYVGVNFLNLPTPGSVLAITMQVVTDAQAFSLLDGKQTANVGVAGTVLNDLGEPVGSFQQRLVIRSTLPGDKLPPTYNLFYNYRVELKPGLYQVRVAAYDEKTGRTGSAIEWIEVPNLTTHRLALSSVLPVERIGGGDLVTVAAGSPSPGNGQPPGVVRANIDRRFARSSYLRFLIFTYNAANSQAPARAAAATAAKSDPPDVAVQVQVLRDDQPVITTTLRKIETEGVPDLTRLPYSAEIPLQALHSGRYLLKVTVIDRIAKTTAFRQFGFWVD
jgi:VWFA-related protein